MSDSPSAIIQADQVRAWLKERDEALDAQARAAATIANVEQRLAAFRLLFPALAEQIVGPAVPKEAPAVSQVKKGKWDARSGGKEPVTDAIVRVLSTERGGRTAKWIRAKLSEDPDFAERLDRNPNVVANSLKRLQDRGLIIRIDNLTYHPDVLDDIRNGRVREEHEPNADAKTFTSVMEEVVARIGRPFTAGDAVEAARSYTFTAEKLQDNPGAVYSWLARQTLRKKLLKEEEYYRLPEWIGAPAGNSGGAPTAGEGATSPIENQEGFRLIG